MQRTEDARETMVLVVIVGGGILVGLLAGTLLALIFASLSVGVALNAYLLASVALRAGKAERLWLAALGALPAGAYDSAKIFAIGAVTWWGAAHLAGGGGALAPGLLVVHLGLLVVAFLIVLNGFLQGRLKAYFDAGLGGAWVVLLIIVFMIYGWETGLAALALSVLYAILARPVARLTATWLLTHPPV